MGETEHGLLTMLIGMWFGRHLSEWSLISIAEVRVQVKPDRYRVADVAVVRADELSGGVLIDPPLIIIEILSPEDRVTRYKERLDDYLHMGVKHLWVIDPVKKEMSDCSTGSWIVTGRLEVPDTPIYLTLEELSFPKLKL